jgi:Uma2 family endonuclease
MPTRSASCASKVGDWLDAGVRLVWVVDPIRREARVYRADGSQSTIESAGTMDGEDVLPGLSCRLADFLGMPGANVGASASGPSN